MKKIKTFKILFFIFIATAIGLAGYQVNNIPREVVIEKVEGLSISKVVEEEKTIEQIIQDIAEAEGLDGTLTLMIADMESNLDPYFTGICDNGTIDRGVMALNSFHFKDITNECAFDPECAIKIFAKEVKAGNLKKWIALKGWKVETIEKYLVK